MRVRMIFLAAIFLGGCEQAPSPLADLHDSKYAAVEVIAGATGDLHTRYVYRPDVGSEERRAGPARLAQYL